MILTVVNALVPIPVALLDEAIATERAQIGPQPCVLFQVVLHIAQLRESLLASLALEQLAHTPRLLA